MNLKILFIIVVLAFLQNVSIAKENIRPNPDGSVFVSTEAPRLSLCSSQTTAYTIAKNIAFALAVDEASSYLKSSKIYLKEEPKYSSEDDFNANGCGSIQATFAKASQMSQPIILKTITLTKKTETELRKGSCGYILEGDRNFLTLLISFAEIKRLKNSEPALVVNYNKSTSDEVVLAEFNQPHCLHVTLDKFFCPQSITIYFSDNLIYKIFLH